jgi:hypothetical protein
VAAGTGGSGVVIIRTPDAEPTKAITGANVVYVNAGGYKIYKFFSSGTILF